MKLHHDELALSRAYTRDVSFEGLTAAQMASIEARAQELYSWYKAHPYLHNTISVLVLAFLFVLDYSVLFLLPTMFLVDGGPNATARVVLTALFCGCFHSYVMYSTSIFSVHEAFTHRVLFHRIGPISRFMHVVAAHICRLAGVDPAFYARHHLTHHDHFGTEDDGELLNFVRPRRFWRSWLPLAAIYTDFACHRPQAFTRGRTLSTVTTLSFHVACGYVLAQRYGLAYPLIAFVICFPHFGFYLDRLRQFTEHNLMPVESLNGSRSFGWGFWGMFLGGGPWGTPCHMEHHLVPYVPWYHQLMLHARLRSVLTPKQREQFLVQPIIGWPKLWWRLLRSHSRVEQSLKGRSEMAT